MKKQLLRTMLLLFALVAGGQSVWGAGIYEKVTSAPTDWSGVYLIVYEGDENHDACAFDGALESLDQAKKGVAVTISAGVITGSSAIDAATFTIAKSGDNYTIKSASGYYIGQTSYANGLKSTTVDKDAYANSIALDNGKAVITSNLGGGDGKQVTLRYNYASDQLRFRYYKSGQQAIALYKLTGYEATITSAGYATFAAPYAVDFSATSLEVYTAQVNGAKNGVVLNEVASKKVPANTAVILKGETAAGAVIATADALEDNDLVAGPVTGDGVSYYALGKEGEKVGFGILADGTELPANKAYIAASKFGASAPAFMPFSFGETTGISEKVIVNSEKFATAPVYNLNGQRVMNPTKGLYIVNGRKVAIK